MKRIIASAGLVALGVASSQASQGLTPAEQPKPWSVGLAVRGFYDDNYTTQVKDIARDSYGVSVNPTAAVNFNLEQTVISFNYSYDMRWFEDRPSNKADHIQIADLKIDHSFTDRLSAAVSDRFVYAQEGSVYFGSGPITTLQSDADYVRNQGTATVKAGLTERIGLSVYYTNELYDYENQGDASYSALLDRMEHLVGLEGNLAVTPNTKGLLGYQLESVGHTSNASLSTSGYVNPDVRDSLSHTVFAGIEHTFSPRLSGALRAGGQFVSYGNIEDYDPSIDDSNIVPYVNASLTYSYNPGSSLTLGVMNTYNQTDVASALDQESLNVYLRLNHRITPNWSVAAMGMFQSSSFNGGAVDGDNELFYIAGVSTNYKLNANLSVEAGYNFDKTDSDLDGRSFSRNRVYVGLCAGF